MTYTFLCFVRLTSLGVIPSKSIHAAASVKISLFFRAEWYSSLSLYIFEGNDNPLQYYSCVHTHTHTHTHTQWNTTQHVCTHTQWNTTQPYVCVYNTTSSLFIYLLMDTGLLSYVGQQSRLSAKELVLSTLVLEKILESLLDCTN